jgi:hypothetical protein
MTMYYVSKEPEHRRPTRKTRKMVLAALATAKRTLNMTANRALNAIGFIYAIAMKRAKPVIAIATLESLRNVYTATAISNRKFKSAHKSQLNDEVIERLTRKIGVMRKGRRPSLSVATTLADALMWRRLWVSYGSRDDLAQSLQVILSAGPALMRDTPSAGRALRELFRILRGVESDLHFNPKSPIRALITDSEICDLYRHIGSNRFVSLGTRIQSLRASARKRASAEGLGAAYEDLASAVALMPRLGWKESIYGAGDRDPLQSIYSENNGLAADAAACAISEGKPIRAIELLEAGRAIQLDTILRRSIESELGDLAPKIARKLGRAARLLDEHWRYDLNPFRATIQYWSAMEQIFDAPLRLANAYGQRRWDRLTRQAQEIMPEGTFRIPEYVRDILPAAEDGPVILLIESQYGSHAAVIHSGSEEPLIIGLSGLTPESVREQIHRYLMALEKKLSPEREGEVTQALSWLWLSVASPVLKEVIPLIGGTAPFRLWWCPSGILSALPVHAAFAASKESQDCGSVLDLTISSYTPTARSLISSRKARDFRKSYPESKEHKLDRLLLVSPDVIDGQEALPSAVRFREDLAELLPPDALVAVTGENATPREIKYALWDQRRVHFDCHGIQNIEHPEKSGLILHEGILAIEDLTLIKTYRPDFAFLASCCTAFPGTKIPDEALSLTSAFQYGGYQHVVGTLSRALDGSARRVSISLYKNIIVNGRLDPELSPGFLRAAIIAERSKYPDYPSTWVPFVHVGI